MTTLDLFVSYSTEDRDTHVAALTREFALAVYAPTKKEIEARVKDAVKFYLDSFAGDPSRLVNYLSEHRIAFSISFDSPEGATPEGGAELTYEVAV